MADFDPPWRLDPLKNIINVGWGLLKYLKIEVNYRKTGNTIKANFPFSTNFDINNLDVFSQNFQVKVPGVNRTVSIVDPISNDMAQSLVAWSRGYKFTNVEGGKQETNTWFFNISKIKLPPNIDDIRIDYTTPAVDATTVGNVPLYYVFPTFITFIPPDGGGNAVFIDLITGNLDEANARVAVLNTHSSYTVITVLTPNNVFANLTWAIAAKQYAGRKNFPFDANGKIVNENEKLKASANRTATGSSGPDPVPLPSQRWRVNYNRKTGALTIKQI